MPRSPSSSSAKSCRSSKRRRRSEKGSAVTSAGAARDRPLSHQSKCLAGQLCRTPSCRFASRHVDHRRHRQLPGQPPHEQSAANAMVPPRRRSPAPVRRLQRQIRFQLRPAVPGRRSCLRAGHGGLTPNRSKLPDLIKGGTTVEKMMLVSVWPEAGSLFTAQERAALRWTETVTRVAETAVPDAEFQAVAPHFSEKELADLTIAIGLMNVYNRIAISFRRPPTPRHTDLR